MRRLARNPLFSVAFVAAIAALPLFVACGSKKPAATASTAASSGGTTGDHPATTGSGDTVTGDAPTPPPPGDTSKLVGSARDAYDRGIASYNVGDLPGAVQAFQSALSSEPKAYEAHYALGITLERQGKNSDALDHYREAYKLNPNYEAAISAYGFLLYKTGKHADAEAFLTDQQAKNPKALGLMVALGEVKSLGGDSAKTQELAGNALTIEGKFEPAMVLIARDHYRRGRLDLAQYVLAAILDGQRTQDEIDKNLPAKKNPPRAANNADAQLLRAMILQKQGERLAAAKWFESALKLRPDLVDAQLQLGLIRLESNDADGALDPLRKAVAFNAASVEAHLALGEAYRLSGSNSGQAKTEYNWVLGSPTAVAQQKALATYDLGLLYFLTPSIDGMSESARYQKAMDYFGQYKDQSKSAKGPSWPSDVDDLIAQASRAKTSADEAAKGAGNTTPKTTTTSPATTAPPATSSAKPATSTPPAATTTTAATTTAKPATSTTAAPPATTTAKPATTSTAAPPKTTF